MAQIYLQSFYFCTEICANDLGTFVGNEEYYFDELVEMNLLGPKVVVKLVGGWCSAAVSPQLCHVRAHTAIIVI